MNGGLFGHAVLRLSALFHDVGKSVTQETDEDGRIRFGVTIRWGDPCRATTAEH